jgi:hypothetical protein
VTLWLFVQGRRPFLVASAWAQGSKYSDLGIA